MSSSAEKLRNGCSEVYETCGSADAFRLSSKFFKIRLSVLAGFADPIVKIEFKVNLGILDVVM